MTRMSKARIPIVRANDAAAEEDRRVLRMRSRIREGLDPASPGPLLVLHERFSKCASDC